MLLYNQHFKSIPDILLIFASRQPAIVFAFNTIASGMSPLHVTLTMFLAFSQGASWPSVPVLYFWPPATLTSPSSHHPLQIF